LRCECGKKTVLSNTDDFFCLNSNVSNLYKNIVNAASNINYTPLLETDDTAAVGGRCFAILFMNELKNLTNVVIGKLGKHVHKQNYIRNFEKKKKNYNIIIVQVRYITFKWPVLDITSFFFLHCTQMKA
jgi:hypothetical protein